MYDLIIAVEYAADHNGGPNTQGITNAKIQDAIFKIGAGNTGGDSTGIGYRITATLLVTIPDAVNRSSGDKAVIANNTLEGLLDEIRKSGVVSYKIEVGYSHIDKAGNIGMRYVTWTS